MKQQRPKAPRVRVARQRDPLRRQRRADSVNAKYMPKPQAIADQEEAA